MARTTRTINLDWKFHRGECPEAWFKGFEDAAWADVTLPHDWSVAEPFSREHSSGGGYLPGGVGWYRTRVELPEELKDRKIWLVFDGVYNNSKIWTNSYYLGKRPYGYSTFALDITHAASFGGNPTQVSVRVNHKNTADSRWFTGSGITRKVSLVAKHRLYIDQYGVFFTVPEATKESATVNVKTTIVNETGAEKHCVVRNTLLDCGSAVAVMETSCSVSAGERLTQEQTGSVSAPRLWSPERPALYTLKTEIVSDGIVTDDEENRVGIRAFRFDADEGFFLNGENRKIKGVCVHHDAGCLGAVVPGCVWARRLKKLKAMGCNAIRMAHNPHMPELYDLCDELGFLVIDEAFDEWEGVKNKWAVGHNVYPPKHFGYYEDFPEWHEKDLAAMVLRDRNHPSVILWSIGNEIDYPNDPYCHPLFEEMSGNNDANKPASERVFSSDKPNAERLVDIAKKLSALVKQNDATRPVTANISFPELSNQTGLADTLDVVGYSYKELWYNEDHLSYPRRILIGSENGKDYSSWLAVRDNDYIASQFLWTGIDFLGEARGWTIHGSMSGLLTTAGFEKPVYFFRKSLWAAEPLVQLAAVRKQPEGTSPWIREMQETIGWNFVSGEEVEVDCYTNCPEAELLLNGVSLGIFRLADFPDRGHITCTVPFAAGRLEAIAKKADGRTVCCALVTAGAPAAMAAEADRWELAANGEDIAQIEVTLVDADAARCPWACDRIHVEVEGPLQLLGIDNGDQADNTEYSAPYRCAYRGNLMVYVRAGRQPGLASVVLRSEGALRETRIGFAVK